MSGRNHGCEPDSLESDAGDLGAARVDQRCLDSRQPIAEHPDGMFSINKIQINKVRKKEVVQNLEFITKKVPTYQEVVELAAGLENEIHPNTIKLDQIVPKTMRQQLRLLFHPVLAESMEKFMETMCKELPCKK